MKPTNLRVHKHRIGPVLGRHPWIFSGAFIEIPEGLEPGAHIHVQDQDGQFLCSGYFGSYSQIAVRVWGFNENEVPDKEFFKKRIASALRLRESYLDTSATDSYRLINSEHDQLPGLIVDRYGDYLSLQFHTKGIEVYKNEIMAILVELLEPKGIYERSDIAVRKIEDAELRKGLLYGEVPDRVLIRENSLLFYVDIKEGQKTGFFLDQREKRQALQKFVHDKTILNCFSYTGGFSVYALAAGAKHVTSVDVSKSAIEMAEENMKLNNLPLEKCTFVAEEAKRYLTSEVEAGTKFDVIVLDPPAFIKDRRKKDEGIVGYKKINEMGVKLLKEEGILLTCSCSHHLTAEDFRHLLSETGGRTRRTLQFLEKYGHGLDHPELVPFTEGNYLKSYFIRAL